MKKLAFTILLAIGIVWSIPTLATVTTSTYTVTYTGSGGTTFTVTFPFIAKNQISVVRKLIAAPYTQTTLTQDTDYTVSLPRTGVNGVVTTVAAVAATHQIIITRATPLTQTTSFKTQGAFLPASHENAFDKLTMIAQEMAAGTTVAGDIDAAITSHEAEADPHTGYLKLAGRAGGQTASGGTAASESLTLRTTTHGTKGKIIMGSAGTELVVDDVNNRVGIGTATPSYTLDVQGSAANFSGDVAVGNDLTCVTAAATDWIRVPDLRGSASSGGDLTIKSTAHATKGNIYFGSASTYDEANGRLGIGDLTPAKELSVTGDADISDDMTANDLIADATLTVAGSLIAGDAATIVGNTHIDGYTTTRMKPGTGQTSTAVVGPIKYYQVYMGSNTGVADPTCNEIYFVRQTDAGFDDVTIVYLSNAVASNAGCVVTVALDLTANVNNMIVQPDASDGIWGSCVGTVGAGAATVVNFSGTVGASINSPRTANQKVGDYVTLTSNGSSGWLVTGCVGIWAN